jgi:hypothetical protein
MDINQHPTESNQHPTDVNQHPMESSQHPTDVDKHPMESSQRSTDVDQHPTKSSQRSTDINQQPTDVSWNEEYSWNCANIIFLNETVHETVSVKENNLLFLYLCKYKNSGINP